MTNEELKEALSQQKREVVDANIGQISLRPTVQQGGQYGVQVKTTPKENAFTQLSKALNQFPQIAGQFANIQRAAGTREIEALDPKELEQRALNGDQGARETIFNRFKSEGINEALFNARYETAIFPGLAAQEQVYKEMDPDQVEKLFQDEAGNPLESEDVIENLRVEYSKKIPDDVKDNPNQQVFYNKLLRQLTGVATKSHALLEQKRQKFLDDSVRGSIATDADSFEIRQFEVSTDTNAEVTDDAGVNAVIGAGRSVLPSLTNTEPPVVRNKISIYAPQKGGKLKKMEGGYKSSVPGADGKSIVRTLEDFRKDPENTVVTVAGNPEFYGRRYVVDSMTYQRPDGKQHTLKNVPVMVHDTGGRFKMTPEGRFDIPVERDTDNRTMAINEGLLKDISFIRDKGSESGKPVKVKRTAKEHIEQRKQEVSFKQEDAVSSIFSAMEQSFAQATTTPGSSLADKTIRTDVEGAFTDKLQDMILNNEHVTVSEFLDRARGVGPKGEAVTPKLFNGEPLSSSMLSALERGVRAQENYLKTDSSLEKTKEDTDSLKRAFRALRVITAYSAQEDPETTKEKMVKAALAYDQESLDNGHSQESLKEYQEAYALASRKLQSFGGSQWNGVFTTPGFMDQLVKRNDPGRQYISSLLSESELMRAADVAGVDLSVLRDTPDDYDTWSGGRKEKWDDLTNGITIKAQSVALPLALEELAGLYQDVGERDPEVLISVRDQDETGKPLLNDDGTPKMTRSNSLFQTLLRKETNKALLGLIKDTKEQKRLIESANRIKGRKAEASTDPMERRAEAVKREEEFGRSDFLDREGKATRQYGKRDDDFSGNDGDFLDRWVKTAENSEALTLMEAQTDKDALASALENVSGRVNKAYLRSAAVKVAENNNKPLKQLELISRLNKQIKYTGVPMTTHEEGMLVKGTYQSPFLQSYGTGKGTGIGYGVTRYASSTEIDINKNDLYSDPSTAKTHVYSFYATREAGFKDSKYERLTKLYNIYFQGQEDTYSKETFIADQTALGKHLQIISAK
jgi:hypothetical protein